jgi:pSer/pThr/pTyr-binding forkhead associated (FHA) protein
MTDHEMQIDHPSNAPAIPSNQPA